MYQIALLVKGLEPSESIVKGLWGDVRINSLAVLNIKLLFSFLYQLHILSSLSLSLLFSTRI
jgi:hypothetical protein